MQTATEILLDPEKSYEIVNGQPEEKEMPGARHKVHAKAMEYLAAGVKQVWSILPENQTITVYRSATNILAFPEDSELVSDDLFPRFRCHLNEIFRNPAQPAK